MFAAKPWLKFYEPHVPEHIQYPPVTMLEILTGTAQKHKERAAINFKGSLITFGELVNLIDRFGAALQALGVKKGDRVALHLPNCPQFVIAYYAVLKIGAIAVPCNPVYKAHEMTYQLNDSEAAVIITLSSTYALIKQIRSNTHLQHVIVAEIKTYFPPALKFLFSLLVEKKKGHKASIQGDTNTYWFTDLIRTDPSKLQPVVVNPNDTAMLMYTGGTTGISKGAELTHKNILVNAYQCKTWLNSPDATEITLTQIPLFHCYGMTTCLNLSMLIASTMLIVPDPRDHLDVIKTIDKYHPTLYPGVPALYNAINNYPGLQKYNLHSIKACISGAAGLPVEVQEKFQSLTGAHLVEGYGLSEASPVTHANPVFGRNCIGTIGLPWPDTDVKIVDVDTGMVELGKGEIGELCIRGPQIMKGYWNMPEETENVLRPDPMGGGPWLHTGDIAVMDADGYFKIVDRKKDMILGAGGYNIYPREIEDLLYQHPKILESAALGIPAGEKGERIKVFVVPKPGEEITEEEIINFCRQNLAPYKIPKYVEFRSQLPKTMVGKILRRELLSEELKLQQADGSKEAQQASV
ncbi:MAG: long-chain-fatty-acid--CoA ligase [Omnitrophica WOR_2 bacterium]